MIYFANYGPTNVQMMKIYSDRSSISSWVGTEIYLWPWKALIWIHLRRKTKEPLPDYVTALFEATLELSGEFYLEMFPFLFHKWKQAEVF